MATKVYFSKQFVSDGWNGGTAYHLTADAPKTDGPFVRESRNWLLGEVGQKAVIKTRTNGEREFTIVDFRDGEVLLESSTGFRSWYDKCGFAY